MNTQVVHHDDPVDDLQQRLVCDRLIGLLQRSPQQQAVVTVATLDLRWDGGETDEEESGEHTET